MMRRRATEKSTREKRKLLVLRDREKMASEERRREKVFEKNAESP